MPDYVYIRHQMPNQARRAERRLGDRCIQSLARRDRIDSVQNPSNKYVCESPENARLCRGALDVR